MTALAPCLMVQGTASGVGKSLLTAALCRLFARAGHRVAPFKAQNMALNAAVTADGGEIGRAQAAQAEAARVAPTVDMNPILLKPESDRTAQLVIRGRAVASVDWAAYAARQPALLPVVAESLTRLRRAHDVVVIEGAGSPAEINLRDRDLVNMRIARLADAPVLLVGDVDRGGVFAALLGTLTLLPPADRARVRGLVVNKLRGDPAVLRAGLDELAARTGVPVLGVVPWITERLVPAEDSLDLDGAPGSHAASARVRVAIVRLPRLANFDDFEPLADEPGVAVRFVAEPAGLAGADLVVLPGSKRTVADLGWLRARGLAHAVGAAAAAGTPVLGVCGGYQMLGLRILDPLGVESAEAATPGLGLLPVVTAFARDKVTVRVRARVAAPLGPLAAARGLTADAYEIHAGRTEPAGAAPAPAFTVVARGAAAAGDPDGAVSADGVVTGTYLHGVLLDAALRGALLAELARRRGRAPDPRWGQPGPDRYDRLADLIAAALDVKAIAGLVGLALPGV